MWSFSASSVNFVKQSAPNDGERAWGFAYPPPIVNAESSFPGFSFGTWNVNRRESANTLSCSSRFGIRLDKNYPFKCHFQIARRPKIIHLRLFPTVRPSPRTSPCVDGFSWGLSWGNHSPLARPPALPSLPMSWWFRVSRLPLPQTSQQSTSPRRAAAVAKSILQHTPVPSSRNPLRNFTFVRSICTLALAHIGGRPSGVLAPSVLRRNKPLSRGRLPSLVACHTTRDGSSGDYSLPHDPSLFLFLVHLEASAELIVSPPPDFPIQFKSL